MLSVQDHQILKGVLIVLIFLRSDWPPLHARAIS